MQARHAPEDGGRSNRFAQQLFAPLPSRYDLLAELLSFGQNGRWRHELVTHAVSEGPERVLDVATGPGGVSRQLARRSTARIVGIDITAPMLLEGRGRIERDGLSHRISLVRGRGEQLPFPDESFDALTFTYLLRYVPDPAAAISELARVVRPGGMIASLEFAVPPRPVWGPLWWCYTRLVLPIAGWVSGGREWWEVGRFLGPSITNHYRSYPIDWTVRAFEQAGIVDVGVRRMSLGGGVVMWGRKR